MNKGEAVLPWHTPTQGFQPVSVMTQGDLGHIRIFRLEGTPHIHDS